MVGARGCVLYYGLAAHFDNTLLPLNLITHSLTPLTLTPLHSTPLTLPCPFCVQSDLSDSFGDLGDDDDDDDLDDDDDDDDLGGIGDDDFDDDLSDDAF